MVQSADVDLSKAKKKLLEFFSQPGSYVGFQLVDIVFAGDARDGTEKLPTLTTLTQGSPTYASELNSSVTGVVPSAIEATRALMRSMKNLDLEEGAADETVKKRKEQRVERLKIDLQRRMEKQFGAVVAMSRSLNQNVYDANEPFDESAAKTFMETERQRYKDKIEPAAMATLQRAAAAVTSCAGLDKLEECVSKLETSQAFDLNRRLRNMDDDDALLKYLGCSHLGFRDADTMLEGWRWLCDEWVPPSTPMSPREVYVKWKEFSIDGSASVRFAANIAMRKFSRPMNAVVCERLFSYLEHMSVSDRTTMVCVLAPLPSSLAPCSQAPHKPHAEQVDAADAALPAR